MKALMRCMSAGNEAVLRTIRSSSFLPYDVTERRGSEEMERIRKSETRDDNLEVHRRGVSSCSFVEYRSVDRALRKIDFRGDLSGACVRACICGGAGRYAWEDVVEEIHKRERCVKLTMKWM